MTQKYYDEKIVEQETLNYFRGDDLATKVWMSKYALVNNEGNFVELTPLDTFKRISKELFRVESSYPNPLSFEQIFTLFESKYFILGGSNLFGIGNNYSVSSLGNCFVLPSAQDSYSSILQTDAEQVQIMKRRGGVGHDLSLLRPAGTEVSNSAKTSTGAPSFMKRFSESTKEVAQDGRRGALMLTMEITHPDSLTFIETKDDVTKLTGANISIKITDQFIEALSDDTEFPLNFTLKSGNQLVHLVKARTIWDKLIYQAWKNGEPGILFWDRIIEESPADFYKHYKTISTNPCSELPLSAYDSCRLGSLILPTFVKHPFTSDAYFDEKKFVEIVRKCQRVMDDAIDLEEEKIDQILLKVTKDKIPNKIELTLWQNIKQTLLGGRRTGLGYLGLADMLAMLNIPYNDSKAITFSEHITKLLALNSYTSSIELASERGAFPEYNKSEIDHTFVSRIINELPDNIKVLYNTYGRRNIANLTLAPTGSIAIISQVSSGIEPVFNLAYTRRRKVDPTNDNKQYQDEDGIWWEEYSVIHPGLKLWAQQQGKKINLKDNPYIGSTTNEIDPFHKVKLQSRIQYWIDHSISVTYNVPTTITPKEIGDLFLYAWESGCKGLTVYREGSRHGVLVNKPTFQQFDGTKRPKILKCDIYQSTIQSKKYTVLVGLLENKPYEIFAFEDMQIKIKKGFVKKIKRGVYDLLSEDEKVYMDNITTIMSQAEEDRTRLISTALRHGTPIQYIVEQLYKSKSDITSFSKAIARTLNRYAETLRIEEVVCPKCHSKLTMEGGCNVCLQCGYSKCL